MSKNISNSSIVVKKVALTEKHEVMESKVNKIEN
jgi:hypothetical protein